MAAFDEAQVIVGSATMYVAPLGTTLPNMDGTLPIVWPAGWEQVGFTDDGVTFNGAIGMKDIKVDERRAPIRKTIDSEKITVAAALAEATLANMHYALPGSTLTSGADVIHLKGGGSEDFDEVMVGFQGPAPGTNQTRVLVIFKAVNTANLGMKYQRGDKTVINVEFEALSDTTKPAGEDMYDYADVTASGS